MIATTFANDALVQRTHGRPVTRLVIFGAPYHTDTVALIRAAQSSYDPMRVLVHGGYPKHPPSANVRVGSLQPNSDGTATAYLCRPSGCSDAFTDPRALAAALH